MRLTPAARKSLRRTLAGAIALAACAPAIKTAHDFDPTVDFSRYRSVAWISAEPLIRPDPGEGKVSYVSPIDDQRIRAAVDAQLAAKGYELVETPADADLVVSFTIGTEEKIALSQYPDFAVYYGGYGYGPWYGGSAVRVRTYTEGTLSLEFFESQSKRAVWVGWASKRLSKSDDREDVIQRAVRAILADLPAR